jgi:CheY-like chemotaxis protein
MIYPDVSEMEDRDDVVVLVVDDNRELADVYSHFLAETYTVKTAYGGEEALGRLGDSVDVVLLDRRMPETSGDEVLSAIRKRGVDCQVALVTSVDIDYDSLPLAFDDYVQKPVSKAALRALVESLCSRLDYSTKLQEYFALVSRRVALQAKKDADEFAEHPEVRRLDERIAELREEVDGLVEHFTESDFRAAFSNLDSTEALATGRRGSE